MSETNETKNENTEVETKGLSEELSELVKDSSEALDEVAKDEAAADGAKEETESKTDAPSTPVDPADEMAEKLKAAGNKAVEKQTARRERDVQGSHLLNPMLEAVKAAGLTLAENTSFHVITNGDNKKKKVYLAKKGGKVDLSGFSLEHEGITVLTAEKAKEKHLGQVRGQLDFTKSDEVTMSAFKAALEALKAE